MNRVCGAKARTNGHQPRQRIPMENGRCHFHGGKVPKHNPDPKTEEGKLRQKWPPGSMVSDPKKQEKNKKPSEN